MATPKQYVFSFKEIAALMVKDVGVKEGHWGIHVRFGLQAGNVGANNDDLKPAAILPILEMGLQRFEEPTSLSVDAAEVNRNPRARKK